MHVYGDFMKIISTLITRKLRIFGCPAALYALMSHPGVEEGPKIYQLYMPSYQNKSCSVCLQDVYLTFLDSKTNN